MSRHKKVINWEEFEKLCYFQCGIVEMCEWLGVSEKTLQRAVKEHYGESFSQTFAKKRVGGLISLRRNLFQQSRTNPACAIFLAKNLLGMTDSQQLDIKAKAEIEFKKPYIGWSPENWRLELSGNGNSGSQKSRLRAPKLANRPTKRQVIRDIADG
ncbi:MAG: hypothetical protein SVY53_11980 [Chloroflexota bacterium]|nr:hypothetical protein [Chloroflexota bacterium]